MRRNLPPLRISGAREAEIVEELALDFQDSYERAPRCGLNSEQAWKEVRSRAHSWRALGKELRAALGDDAVQAPEPTRRENMVARFVEDLRRDLRYAARPLWFSCGRQVSAGPCLLGIA